MARALFIGSRSPLATGAVAGWLASGNEIVEFWTAERGMSRAPLLSPELSAARLLARHGVPVRPVPRLSKWPGLMEAVAAVGADLLITCATDMIVPANMLEHFGARAVNLHPTMLPNYRGPGPYMPVLLDGRADSDGGVTLHVLSVGIDEGDIIAQERVTLSANGGRFTRWYVALIGAGYRLMRDELPAYLKGEIVAWPQVGGTYVKRPAIYIISPDDDTASVAQVLERAGSTMQVAVIVPGRERPVRVTGIKTSTARNGEPALLRPLTVALDFADARLTLRRATVLERRREQWRLAWALRRFQL